MDIYKRYGNPEEDVIFGGWAIGLSVALGILGVIGGMYSLFTLKDIFVAHGLKADDIPAIHFVITVIISAFALAIGLLNLFAFARRFSFPKLKLPNRKYKF